MSDGLSYDPPIIYSEDGGETWIKAAPGRHRPGSNKWLRGYKGPGHRLFCVAYGNRRRLFGVVHEMGGRKFLKLASLVPRGGDSASLNSWPLDGAWGDEHVGTCPCGRMHVIDGQKVREAIARGDRWSDVARVSVTFAPE